MSRPAKKSKSAIASAVVQVRTKLGESQQAFSNRLGVAIQTVARWETHRPPSGEILLALADLANQNECKQASEQFTQKYFSDLQRDTARKAPYGALLQDFKTLVKGLRKAARKYKKRTDDPQVVRDGLQEIIRLIDWPQLDVLKYVIHELESISTLANPIVGGVERDLFGTAEIIDNKLEALEFKLTNMKLPFDSYFNRGRETGADEGIFNKVPSKKRKT